MSCTSVPEPGASYGYREPAAAGRTIPWPTAIVRPLQEQPSAADEATAPPPPFRFVSPRAPRSLGCHMDQGAGIGVFQQPQRAIRGLRHIADALAQIPALGGLGSAFAVEDDASERMARQAADEAVAVPLREGFRTAVEHQVAWCDDRNPIGRRFRELGPGGGSGDRHLVVVHPVGDDGPAVVLALLDEVQLVAAARAMFDLPELTGGGERQAVGGADATRPGFRGREVGAGKGIAADHGRGLGGLGVLRRIDQRNLCRTGLAQVRLARGWLSLQRQVQDLAYGLVRVLGRSHALAVAGGPE